MLLTYCMELWPLMLILSLQVAGQNIRHQKKGSKLNHFATGVLKMILFQIIQRSLKEFTSILQAS
jgi:ABC-type polysaccharide/polyol phosphate export permease